MPKIPIDYSKTVVYKLINYDCPENEYVGSTTNFTRRKQNHKHHTTNIQSPKYNRRVYKIIRENGGWEAWHMIEIKKYPCENRREAEMQEDRIMHELKANMNMIKAFRTEEDKKKYEKDYRKDNRETIKSKAKAYRDINKEKLKDICKAKWTPEKEANKQSLQKEEVACECGCTFRRDGRARHLRSNKHKKLIEEFKT